MSRTFFLALRDLLVLLLMVTAAVAVLIAMAVGIFLLCLQVLARLIW